MDIKSLIDRPTEEEHPSSSATSSPVTESRRQTVSSLLNDDDDVAAVKAAAEKRKEELRKAEEEEKEREREREEERERELEKEREREREAERERELEKERERELELEKEKEKEEQKPKKSKPKRYDTPPIWAQSWKEFNKKFKQTVKLTTSSGLNNSSSNSEKARMFPTITGVVPFEDLTRKITEWIYGNIAQLEGEDRKNVEIELKLGTICEKSTEQRLQLPVVTETAIRSDYGRSTTFFQAYMNDEQFTNANSVLDDLAKNNSLSRTMSKTRDTVFSSGKGPGKTRVTFNEQTQETTRIIKTRVADLMIFSPGDLLDIRISISTETPTGPSSIENQQPSTVRHKNRQSYSNNTGQIDLTSVVTGNSNKATKELEIELDSEKLLGFYGDYLSGIDPEGMDKFEELIRVGIDNTRIISRKISR